MSDDARTRPSIHADIAAVLAFARRVGVPEARLDAIRDGDRRTCLALLAAIREADTSYVVHWCGVRFAPDTVAPVADAAQRLRALLLFVSRAGFRQVMGYGRTA